MRKTFIFGAVLTLFVMAVGVSAQNNFAGNWTLDKEKSELGERSRIKSMTMNVTHTNTELNYERKAEREEREGGGGRGGRGGGGNAGAVTYKLDGSETSADIERGRATGTVKRKAESKDGKLILSSNMDLETPRGSFSTKTTETWELSEDGKTLTISTERETRRGNVSTKMVFAKS